VEVEGTTDLVHLEGEPASQSTLQQYLGMIIVFLSFIAILGAYVALQAWGVQAATGGPLDDLLLILGGAVAALATPVGRAVGR
jgi:hypothetical protein